MRNPIWIAAVFLFVVLAGCRSVVAPEPLNVNQTVIRNGVLYQIHEREPYTGEIVSYYLTGKLKARAQYREGLLDGKQAEFRQDGQPLSASHWRAGRRHGSEMDWYENGQVAYEAHWEDGRPAGEFRGWYPDGKPAFHITVRAGDGKGRALRLAWNDTIVKEFPDVLIDGPWVEYQKFSGRITRQELYRDGILIEKRD